MGFEKLKVSAPGRICLFGEHQDYLNLPVITAAINLRIEIEGAKRNDRTFTFNLPDIKKTDSFSFNGSVNYTRERDYLRSAFNVLVQENVNIPTGYDCTIKGNIPINSGTSSSSALIVAWIKFLLTIAENRRAESTEEIARLAHQAEVLEFNEPGGMMDHYATSMGGVLFLDFKKPVRIERFDSNWGTFVLGDSLEPKNTKGILARVKGGVFEILQILNENGITIDLKKIQFEEILKNDILLTREQLNLMKGTLENRDITIEAYNLFQQNNIKEEKIGNLLTLCHKILSKVLNISTPKIDNMIETAIAQGASGGKINGSGGGGCMFVTAGENPKKVATAITRTGGIPYIVKVDQGVKIDHSV